MFQTREHFILYSLAENLEEAKSYTSQVVDFSSFGCLEKSGKLLVESDAVQNSYSMTRMTEKIQHPEELLSITPRTDHHNECLSILAQWYQSKSYHTKDILDAEESIKYSWLSLNATHPSVLWRITPLASLHNILNITWKKTSKISHLNKSITISYDILELRSAQHAHLLAIWFLVQSPHTHKNFLRGRGDLHHMINVNGH